MKPWAFVYYRHAYFKLGDTWYYIDKKRVRPAIPSVQIDLNVLAIMYECGMEKDGANQKAIYPDEYLSFNFIHSEEQCNV